MTDHSESLPTVAVVGLGKIGLTLAAVFANHRYNVFGADINPDVTASVNQGISHIQNEPGLDELVWAAHQNNALSATTATAEAVSQADTIVVIVPVLTDEQNQIDYRMIDRAVEDVANGIQKDALVIFETTLPPGDTENRFGKMIKDISGLRPGRDFDLAYSPERVYSNQIIHDLEHYPKIVGGINEKSLERAADFYKTALGCEMIEVSSPETAEFAKVAECVYRDVNIALANELARFAEDKGVQMTEVINASNSQPYANIHSPGIGVGGHCIPIYPYFFINKGLSEGLTPLSRKINDNMADYAITKIEERIGSLSDKNILILGLSYRGNVKEPTKSTALMLIDQLQEKGANPFVNDPSFSDREIRLYDAAPLALNDQHCSEIDVVILQAFHDAYNAIDFSHFTNCQLILDGRNKLNQKDINRLGIAYEGIGNEGGLPF
ncbi:nucleotide sugar dehydrogenase [Lentibacillus sp. CBA3610]|uniref:nucleotide sugar dehydrogenase n=1 Tax=Lentibacillus sp. CBA3610 TaxID=2518176 RepID=UPI0020D201BB|nr:nucleotide sugar dehydrogenase [Lentibacillus sp. CBA3610]